MAAEEWKVGDWLKSFGFERYLSRFLENGYETKKLCSNLKAEDLDEMRITEPPHRSIIFNQSDMLKTGKPCTSLDNGYVSVPSLPASPESPTVSMASSDLNSETYSTVFDDISETHNKSKSIPALHTSTSTSNKPSIAKKPALISTSSSDKPLSKTLGPTSRRLGSPARTFKLNTSQPLKTKVELKMVIRDFVQRDALHLNQPPYCNENGSANVPALAEVAENYADELNIESLTVMDALEDVWRYKMNENSEHVIPKTAKLSNVSVSNVSVSSNPGSAGSNNSFVFHSGDSMYTEPFNSKQHVQGKPLVKHVHNSTSSVPNTNNVHREVSPTKSSSLSNVTSTTNDSTYLDPFDAIDTGTPIIVKTSPMNEKKKPSITPKPNTLKNFSEVSKDVIRNPDSPSLSTHSSSSEDADKSPKIPKNKSWLPFRRSEKSPNIQKRKLKKRLSGSMEMLEENASSNQRGSSSRQSMPPQPNGVGLPRSISTNPALLYRESLQSNLVDDLRQSKKKFGGSHGTLNQQYSPKTSSPIANEFHKAGTLPSPTVKSRIKALTLGQGSSELELSSVIEVYTGQGSDPIYFRKSQTFNGKELNLPIQEKKSKGGLISRFFKKKDKTKHDQSIEEEDNSSSDGGSDENEEVDNGLTSSHSLPNIAATIAQANIHSEYTELYDLLEPKIKPQATPPKLPSRNRLQSHDTLSPQSSPPTHHKLMVKSDSTSSSEIIHSLPSSGDDVIEIRNPTNTSAVDTLYNEPWTHIPINRSPGGGFTQSPNSKLTSSRRSSGSSSGSPGKKSSLTIDSPIRRRKLFEDTTGSNGGHFGSQTLPKLPHKGGVVLGEPPMNRRRESMDKMVVEETLFRNKSNTLGVVSEHMSSKRRGRCLSTEDIFLTTPLDEEPVEIERGLSRSDPRHTIYSKARIHRIQSSPGLGNKRRNILEQLKQTGISFEGQDMRLTPPVSPDNDVTTVTDDITKQQDNTGHYCEVIPPTRDYNSGRRSSDGVVQLQMKKLRNQSKHRTGSKNRNRTVLELRVESLLESEGIDLTVLPYSNLKGEYGIPTALISRYAQDVSSKEEELVKTFDAIRRTDLLRLRRAHIPFKKDWRKFSDISTVTLEDFLVSTGLPQYYYPLMDIGITSTADLQVATNYNLSSLPLKEPHKRHLRAFVKRL